MDWAHLTKEHIELALPLLIVKGSRGFLACGYISLETCEKTGEACAIVTGVKKHEDMLTAKVQGVSSRAKGLGARTGMTGREVLEIFR
jgi:uncharacterized protein YunC (DUF1805 family)